MAKDVSISAPSADTSSLSVRGSAAAVRGGPAGARAARPAGWVALPFWIFGLSEAKRCGCGRSCAQGPRAPACGRQA